MCLSQEDKLSNMIMHRIISVSVCVCVCKCMCVGVCVCTHKHTCMHINTCTHTHTHTQTHTPIYDTQSISLPSSSHAIHTSILSHQSDPSRDTIRNLVGDMGRTFCRVVHIRLAPGHDVTVEHSTAKTQCYTCDVWVRVAERENRF